MERDDMSTQGSLQEDRRHISVIIVPWKWWWIAYVGLLRSFLQKAQSYESPIRYKILLFLLHLLRLLLLLRLLEFRLAVRRAALHRPNKKLRATNSQPILPYPLHRHSFVPGNVYDAASKYIDKRVQQHSTTTLICVTHLQIHRASGLRIN